MGGVEPPAPPLKPSGPHQREAGTRLAPSQPFPPYRHEPGTTPHPYRHADGHSHGRPEPTVSPLDPAAPFESEAYLFGFDLFNYGYFWESHVWWEALWHAHGRTGEVAELLRALIRLAAAGVKARAQVPGGVRKHCRATAGILDEIRERTATVVFVGLHLEQLATQARWVADATPDHGPHPHLVDGCFEWWLAPVEP